MKILLDTNVLSELLRSSPNPAVPAWVAAQRQENLFVSSVTQAEMMLGASLLPTGKRRRELESGLMAMFDEDFDGRILPFDSAAVSCYVSVVHGRRAAGRPISQFDAQIAAIALSRDCALATHNLKDFENCGVELIDPWKSVPAAD